MFFNKSDWEEAMEDDRIEAEALMKDMAFEDGFDDLQKLDDKIVELQRDFNLKLQHLRNNPPDDKYMPQWRELQGIKPYPVNEY